MSNCTTRMHGGEKQKLPPDELVLTIQIEWSDNRTNDVTRTLNEVSILERDMRHGMYTIFIFKSNKNMACPKYDFRVIIV